ncbi:MAG: toll/interleukin-1 receptor domain-containing protein [Desulfobacteraceae bacterium]|nr:toll/interleukin-1 receptor domain-containing protein [Desulfobacteraceae bacterium]
MECGHWDEEDWEALILNIEDNNCILMIGPDASVINTPENKASYSCTKELANELANTEKIKETIKLWNIDPFDLAQVSLCYLMKIGRASLHAKVKAFYQKRKDQTNDLYMDLAALPFYFTLTSNHDFMFYEALKKVGKLPVIDSYNFNGGKKEMVQMGTVKEPLIFYLYGKIQESQSLVLTENDLLDLLVTIVSKTPSLPHNILNELQKKNKSLLFLGFSFTNSFLRILLHVLKMSKNKKESRSYALEQFAPNNIKEFQNTIFYFGESDYRIQICNKDINLFVKELNRRYEQSSSNKFPKLQTANVQRRDAPTAFLCHANADKEYADSLYTKLKAIGIKPWLDKNNLRGGDIWDPLIVRTITKEIDYFIVLQSKALIERPIGYVNKEINCALEHQKRFRASSGIRFIIPIIIGECNSLEEFEGSQSINLSDKDNIDELASIIKRDQQLRKR